MAYLRLLWIFYVISICTADTLNMMVGHVHNQMNYNPTGSSLAQLIINKKLICAAQCAHQYPTCNTAVFDGSVIPQCLLFSEPVIPTRLVVSTNAIVYDFQQNKLRATTSTTTTSTTTTTTTTACVLSSQSSWSQSAITIAGSSSGSSGSDLFHLSSPIAMYYDQTNNLIIVGDHGNGRVIQFSLNNPSSGGTVIAGGNGGGCSLTQLYSTVGVALDNSRQLYVSDVGCNRILRFPSNSNSATSGVLVASLSAPEGIFIHPLTGDLYAAAHDDSSVVKIASGNVVVVAGGNSGGTGLNQVSGPINVYFDSVYTNSLYVADSGNNRILKFPSGSTSATYGTIVAGGNSAGSGSNQFNDPRSLVVDRNGVLYISDGTNNRIQRWLPNASSGTTVVGGTIGTASNQLNFPEVIVFDKNYNLLVVDRQNNRIQMFNITVC